MKFTWIGGPSFVLEIGPFRVVGDPVLRESFELEGAGTVRRLSPLAPIDLAGADVALVTSLRPDHCDNDALARCGAGTVLVPAGGDGVVEGASMVTPGENVRVDRGPAALTIAAVPAGQPGAPGARDNGYFLCLESGAKPFTVYVTGDTTFSEETREIQRVHGYSNLLVIHTGAERSPDGTLRSADAKEAMQIVYRMQPNAIALVHHTTFSHYIEPVAPLIDKIGLTIYEKRLRALREGESFQKTLAPAE